MTAAVVQLRIAPESGAIGWDTALEQWAGWCRAGGNAESTIRLRRTALLRFVQTLNKGPLEVTIGDCAAFTGAPGLAQNTRKVRRGALRSFYVYAVETGLVDTDPTLRLPKPRAPRGLPRPCPDAVFEKALAEATDRDRLILLLGALAGLRRAEIAGLRWGDVVLGPNGSLRVTGKGGRTRIVPMHPDLAAEVAAERLRRRNQGRPGTGHRYQPEGPETPWLFPGKEGGHVHPNTVGRAARAILDGQATTHTLRHRFGVRSYRATHDLLAVSQLLGHASVAMTQTYASADAAALTAAVLATR